MKSVQIFIFGLINFSLLAAWLFRFGKKISRQYFYARKMVIRKQMASSGKMLRDAKQRAMKIRGLLKTLDNDIENRRKNLLKNADEDCAAIIDSANAASKRVIENTIRQTEEDRRKALLDVRDRILKDAFSQTEAAFKDGMTLEIKKHLIETGFSELPGIINTQKTQSTHSGASK